jgi:hypothetical protein
MYRIVNYVRWIVKARFLFHFVHCYLLYMLEYSLVGADTLVLIVVHDLCFLNSVRIIGLPKRFETFNPLNAELNPICHLLLLLGDLTFMGTCIVSIFQYISNKMQRYTVYLYLETALHISGGTFTHHLERIQLYLQHLVFVTPLLLPAATGTGSNSSTIAADSSNGVTNTRCCRYSCMRS